MDENEDALLPRLTSNDQTNILPVAIIEPGGYLIACQLGYSFKGILDRFGIERLEFMFGKIFTITNTGLIERFNINNTADVTAIPGFVLLIKLELT